MEIEEGRGVEIKESRGVEEGRGVEIKEGLQSLLSVILDSQTNWQSSNGLSLTSTNFNFRNAKISSVVFRRTSLFPCRSIDITQSFRLSNRIWSVSCIARPEQSKRPTRFFSVHFDAVIHAKREKLKTMQTKRDII